MTFLFALAISSSINSFLLYHIIALFAHNLYYYALPYAKSLTNRAENTPQNAQI